MNLLVRKPGAENLYVIDYTAVGAGREDESAAASAEDDARKRSRIDPEVPRAARAREFIDAIERRQAVADILQKRAAKDQAIQTALFQAELSPQLPFATTPAPGPPPPPTRMFDPYDDSYSKLRDFRQGRNEYRNAIDALFASADDAERQLRAFERATGKMYWHHPFSSSIYQPYKSRPLSDFADKPYDRPVALRNYVHLDGKPLPVRDTRTGQYVYVEGTRRNTQEDPRYIELVREAERSIGSGKNKRLARSLLDLRKGYRPSVQNAADTLTQMAIDAKTQRAAETLADTEEMVEQEELENKWPYAEILTTMPQKKPRVQFAPEVLGKSVASATTFAGTPQDKILEGSGLRVLGKNYGKQVRVLYNKKEYLIDPSEGNAVYIKRGKGYYLLMKRPPEGLLEAWKKRGFTG